MTPALGADTGIIIAAVLDGSDAYWNSWVEFDRREGPVRFLPFSALEEYSLKVEVGGSDSAGLLPEIIGDGFRAILNAWGRMPTEPDVASLELGYNRTQRALRLVDVLFREQGASWNSDRATQLLREFDRSALLRKRDFLSRHPIFDPADRAATSLVRSRLSELIPSGGMSWRWDCKILAEVGQFRTERGGEVEFVTEDVRHMRPHSAAIRAITNIRELRTLQGVSIT